MLSIFKAIVLYYKTWSMRFYNRSISKLIFVKNLKFILQRNHVSIRVDLALTILVFSNIFFKLSYS